MVDTGHALPADKTMIARSVEGDKQEHLGRRDNAIFAANVWNIIQLHVPRLTMGRSGVAFTGLVRCGEIASFQFSCTRCVRSLLEAAERNPFSQERRLEEKDFLVNASVRCCGMNIDKNKPDQSLLAALLDIMCAIGIYYLLEFSTY